MSQEAGRGVYSFCMCPGGFIVPAMTDAAQSVVNGMSPSGRTSPYANSGMVTEVRPADFEHLRAEWGELAGLKFQQQFEELARQHGGEHQVAPAQRVADFVAGRPSAALPKTSYIPVLFLRGSMSGCPRLSARGCAGGSPPSGGGCGGS